MGYPFKVLMVTVVWALLAAVIGVVLGIATGHMWGFLIIVSMGFLAGWFQERAKYNKENHEE